MTYAYDQASHLIGVSDNSAAIAAAATQASYATTYTYDALNRPTNVSWSPAATQMAPNLIGVTFTHGYDADNRRISQAANDNSWLLYPTIAGTTSYTANNLNQYTAVGAASPAYDGNGAATSDGTLSYTYDAESRLTALKQGATTLGTYAYDAQGRRRMRTVGSTTTVYVTDADNREVLEYDGTSGLAQRWYSYGLGPNAVLNQMNVALGTRETMVPDIQGSIMATLDSGQHTLTKANYLPCGENTASPTAGFRYTGSRLDPEASTGASQPSGLYYLRARIYSATWGRFMQPDPIGYGGGINLYAYVANDPLDLVDPSGLATIQLGLAGGATILGIVVPQGGFGLTIDTHGNVGTYSYGGIGIGVGAEANVDLSVQFSNAKTISDLSGPFTNASFHGGAGLGGSLDVFSGQSANGQVTGGGITFGAGAGASFSLTTTTTEVCGSQGCAGPLPSPSAPSSAGNTLNVSSPVAVPLSKISSIPNSTSSTLSSPK